MSLLQIEISLKISQISREKLNQEENKQVPKRKWAVRTLR